MSIELHCDALKPSLEPLRKKRLITALSGGVDSVVLLHLLVSLRNQGFIERLEALHVDHQLSPNSKGWQQHCVEICAQWDVPLKSVVVDVQRTGGGLEEAARDQRYTVIEDECGRDDCVVFAHHRQDQVETLLYRMLRGAGARGLGGMPEFRRLKEGVLIRPLLPFSREQIQEYAQRNDLAWCEDESNATTRFDRNFLRHRILPVLRERWPQVDSRLIKQAKRLAEDAALLDELASMDLQRCLDESPAPTFWLSRYGLLWLPAVAVLSDARTANLLRYWLRNVGVAVPGEAILEQILKLIDCREDASPVVGWHQWQLRRYQQYLVVMTVNDTPLVSEPLEKKSDKQWLSGNGCLLIERLEFGNGRLQENVPDLQIAYRHELDTSQRIRIAGREGSKTLKKLMQEHGLPPWLRARIPLLTSGGVVIAAPDLWVVEGFAAAEGEPGLRFAWQLPNSAVTH